MPTRNTIWRNLLAWILLVIGCLFAALAFVAVWAETLVLDQDRYVDAVGPLASEDAVQDAIGAVVIDAIMSRISPPAGTGVTRSMVEEAVDTVVGSDAFAALWTRANRFAHDQLVALLTGVDTDLLQTRDGEVFLELGPVVEAVANDLSPLGLDISSVSAVAAGIEFPLLTTTDVEPAQLWLRRIERAAFWFPPACIAALALAFWSGPRRWRAAGRTGAGLVGSGLLVLLAIAIAQVLYLDRTVGTVPDVVAERLFARLVDPLRVSALVLAMIGGAVAIVAYTGVFLTNRLRR